MEVESVNNNNKKTSSSSSSATASNMNHSKKKNPAVAQYNADARLMSQFEQSVGSGKSFNYSTFVQNAPQEVPEDEMTAYLSRIQRGGFVQPFGCMIAIQEPTFRIIGYSENCYALLGLTSLVESEGLAKGLIGVDAKTLFTLSSRASLENAVGSREISMLNPIWVHSRSTNRPFYAILHRIDVGIVIDLEPAHSGDPALLLASAAQSQKLAVRAISRLQSLPGGDIGALCDTVVEDVQKLTGYDRVMVYKFHEDEHGEIVSEIRRSDTEPYLGLHFPATDIPQAARFLFKQNHVRIICNCHDIPIQVIQSEELKQPICLVNSTLRQPHGCHLEYMANMKCIASLVMSVVINSNDSLKLWGLVVCHHCSPRYVPFPLRYACEFLMQAMGLQLNMELQLAAQLVEKKILRMQTLLCDMLLRDAPFGIVTQSPSIMDLVKCDGAALYYRGKCWLLGVTPTESQVRDIVHWLLTNHEDSTGLSTESLCDAGYPHAAMLCDRVCGVATARISSNDFLFWFRSPTANEIKWGGAKHLPEDKDDGQKMHPRSSFKTFLEVTKSRSLPWEVSEINAIHSLQLIMRESFQQIEDASSKVMVSGQENNESDQVQELDELSSVACEMVRLIETASVPIFGVDSSGLINGWNAKTAQLTGLQASEAMGKSLINEVIHESSHEMVEKLLCRALQGEEEKNIELKLLKVGIQQPNAVIYIVANTCTSRDYMNKVVGVCFVGQDVTSEKIFMDKFICLQGDYKAIIQSLNPLIPPIFASDESACCTEWNVATEKLTGWMRHEVIGKVLPGEIFGGICQLKSPVTLTKFKILLYQAINGHDNTNLTLSFLTKKGEWVDVFLTANKRTDQDGKVIGCFCFLQTRGLDLQQTVENREGEREFVSKSIELAYIRQEIKNPLNGLRFTHRLLESTAISDDQKQFLETSDACERQIVSIIEDTDLGSIEEGRVELNMEEFILENILDAIVSQVMIVVKEKHLQLFHEIPDHVKALPVYGDQIRLQLVLSDFLLNIVRYAPSPDGWVEIKVSNGLKLIQDGNKFIHLHFRMSHPGEGLPPALIEDMLDERNGWTSQEGLALNLSRKLLNMMNGNVDYVRDENKCYFSIDLQLRTSK